MEANYPYAIKNQRGASIKHQVGGFVCDELVLYGIRLLARPILESILDVEVEVEHSAWQSLQDRLTLL